MYFITLLLTLLVQQVGMLQEEVPLMSLMAWVDRDHWEVFVNTDIIVQMTRLVLVFMILCSLTRTVLANVSLIFVS